ncbi:ABC transporter ATP-binding protein [Xanthobacter dioxanivorans]|uniref:ABC transporter ATP-binding protein n=1 Tax=Xanthobacter dioxanivorans TaxID=2528964 RepID=A0A974SJZ4_9HYPH|nr:ABC transporter ATP-binding protein [Xanthobacter dioxanivorans]QRG08951.1 ABC transporter ATP-binding protein [Xanthobacter dioxanivorans]
MAPQAISLLSVTGLRVSYGGPWVLDDISLEMAESEFLAIIGANTAGKSSFVRALSGLVPKVEGRMVFAGADLRALEAHSIPQLGIAHVPEGRHVFPKLTVEENLRAGAYLRGSKAEIIETLAHVYDLFPRLKERFRQLAGTLSGGEQQMVAVGRGMMLRPRLLILDEPSLGLAPKVVEEMHQRFIDIHAAGTSVLLIEQNVSLALSCAQRAYVFQSGRIAMEGRAQDMLNDDSIRRAYLGI